MCKTRAGLNEPSLDGGDSSLVSSGMLALAPPRVGVVVYSRVSRETVSDENVGRIVLRKCLPSELV